ncbi:MAG: FHA domain-containing protein [Ktedonobacteraceae bacterium]|nr:FHA domain-containing protein [Ktedonobacteraceae bacterium]
MEMVNSPSVLGSIHFLSGPMAGKTFLITKPLIYIGRGGDPNDPQLKNDVVIADPAVSRQHAQLLWNGEAWMIRKLAPKNIVTVNQREVEQSPLAHNDTIGLGPTTTFRFEVSIPSSTPLTARSDPFSAMPPASSPPSMPPVSAFSSVPPASSPPSVSPAFAPLSTQASGGTEAAFSPPMAQAPSTGTERASGEPTLEVSTNTDRNRHTYRLAAPVIDIGRDPSLRERQQRGDPGAIWIDRPTVSGFHAQIVREGNRLVFIHPHPQRGRTLNGIDYKGRAYRGNEQFRLVLTRGDVLRISDENGTFVTLTYNDGTGAPQEAVPEIRPIALGAPVITLGRLPDNMVVLNHPQVSGHHARLEQAQGGYRIVDLRSTNHTYVNGQRVHTRPLNPGDEIRIGPFKLAYTGTHLAQHDESSGVRIDALRLVRRGNQQVVLLNDISLVIPPRKFVALVGGSGAGKSTLLNALNGLRPAQQGTVLYNGQDYYKNLAAFSTQLGYVPQDDIIHRDLTVERALYYAARMRLPDDFTKQQIRQRIEEVLEDVEMKKQRNLLISKLSGGQRKRVSIALELLANPSVFFLDEPTSGLDPGLDRKMMSLMRRLADRGRTIVLVTHATNNINACDYVCFLARGGRLAYFGPPDEAKEYFEKSDFAEIYSALEPTDENPDIPAQAEARFRQSPAYQRYVLAPLQQGGNRAYNPTATTAVKPPKRGNPWKQFRILAVRYLELLKNDTANLAILLLQAPIIALVLLFLMDAGTFAVTSVANCPTRANITDTSGPIVSRNCNRVAAALDTEQGQAFLQQQHKTKEQVLQEAIAPGSGGDAQKDLFIMAFAAVMFGCINGSREIVKEAAIYRRERAVNLGIIPYIFSKFFVLGLLCLLQSLILVAVVFARSPIERLPSQQILFSPFVEIYITMALTSIAGLMIGLTISAIVSNNDRAMSLVPLALLPQVIFAGVVFSLDKSPLLQVIGAFFPTRWAMAAMGSTVGLHGDKLGADDFSFKGLLFSTTSKPEAVAHLLLCWVALAITIVILGWAIGWFLKRKDIRS